VSLAREIYKAGSKQMGYLYMGKQWPTRISVVVNKCQAILYTHARKCIIKENIILRISLIR
jgi:hypothetical protein